MPVCACVFALVIEMLFIDPEDPDKKICRIRKHNLPKITTL